MVEKRAERWAGLSVMGGYIVGVVGLFGGVFSIFNETDFIGAELCFLASALAFGLPSHTLYRPEI